YFVLFFNVAGFLAEGGYARPEQREEDCTNGCYGYPPAALEGHDSGLPCGGRRIHRRYPAAVAAEDCSRQCSAIETSASFINRFNPVSRSAPAFASLLRS